MRRTKETTQKILLRKLANALTLFRVFAGFAVILALENESSIYAWLLIFIAGLSDIADGILARKAGGGSEWGTRLDPLADKILITAPLLWLARTSLLPIWAVWLLLSRELIITSWRASKKQGGAASLEGKSKTILQFLCVLLMLWPQSWGGITFAMRIQNLGWYIFWPSLLIALVSGWRYLNSRQVSDLM